MLSDQTVAQMMATPDGLRALADYAAIEAAKDAATTPAPSPAQVQAVAEWMPAEYDPAFQPTGTQVRARVTQGTSPDEASATRDLYLIHRYREAHRRRAEALRAQADELRRIEANTCDICGQHDRSGVHSYPAYWGTQYQGLRHRIRTALRRDVRAHDGCMVALDLAQRQRAAATKVGRKSRAEHAAAWLDAHPDV
jgi:hypothetical protein